MSRALVLCSLLLILLTTSLVSAVDVIPQLHTMTLVVASNTERCVYAVTGTKNDRVLLHYQVRSGSSDFNVRIRSPNDKMVYHAATGEHEHEDKIFFVAKEAGEYAFCIDNVGFGGDKTVRMSVALMSVKKSRARMDPLMKAMSMAEAGLIELHEDQVFMRARERDHRVTLESNNTRMTVRWVIELAAMLALSLGQVYFLQKLFKDRRERAA